MIDPPRWSAEELQREADISTGIFRKERLAEPLEQYADAFDACQGDIEDLFEITVDLTELDTTAAGYLTQPRLLHVFRYLTSPPISIDDLKTVADVKSLNASHLKNDSEAIKRIVEVIRLGFDHRRFPWLRDQREPTEPEKISAILASAALMATFHVGTKRRSEGKAIQESRVAAFLDTAGFQRVASRRIKTHADQPAPETYCPESYFGTAKADFVVGLWDNRIMPIECKVSNSSTNSVKRLNRESAGKAELWRREFGEGQVVPVGVLSGVYKLHNLQNAQQRGLTIIWAHDLKVLVDWIEKTHSN